jgi:hypothetical protein
MRLPPLAALFYVWLGGLAAAGSPNPSLTGVVTPTARVCYARLHFQLNTNTVPVDWAQVAYGRRLNLDSI